jgi:hypothetical protein
MRWELIFGCLGTMLGHRSLPDKWIAEGFEHDTQFRLQRMTADRNTNAHCLLAAVSSVAMMRPRRVLIPGVFLFRTEFDDDITFLPSDFQFTNGAVWTNRSTLLSQLVPSRELRYHMVQAVSAVVSQPSRLLASTVPRRLSLPSMDFSLTENP